MCVFLLVFVGFNLEHTSDVSVIFHTFTGVPVFFTAFSSFIFGMLFAMPFILSFAKRRKKLDKPSDNYLAGEKAKNKTFITDKTAPKKDVKKDEPKKETDEVKKENSPYGID